MMARLEITWLLLCAFICLFDLGEAIQCYQCDSNEDSSCPSGTAFDVELNAPVDCNSFEAKTPGQFCMKITQESPGWGGWKKVTRRCGSRTDSGVAWGCRWSWDVVGVFKEICYCESDMCNGSTRTNTAFMSVAAFGLFGLVLKYLFL